MNGVKQFLVAFTVFLVIDLFWLGIVSKRLYAKYLGYLMAENINFVAAILFYLIFIVGLVYFVIHPALIKESFKMAVFSGMLFGLVTYSTYDLTNLATVKNWPMMITIIDLIWGTVLSGSVSAISYLILKN